MNSDSLEYLKYNKLQKFVYNFKAFLLSIPKGLASFFISIGGALVRAFTFLKEDFLEVINTFKKGDFKTKLSFIILGFGNICRGQFIKGLLFLLFEAAFILYMVFCGARYLSKITLTNLEEYSVRQETIVIDGKEYITTVAVEGDDTFKILLYSVFTFIFIACFIYTWRQNIKQNTLKGAGVKQYLNSITDDKFHVTVLSLPTLGIFFFTVVPIIFMILIAFTNYDGHHAPPTKLFEWVGLENFSKLFSWTSGSATFSATFGEIVVWTLIWAFFATFTNYFLGMFIAIAINKKGIKGKKWWRGALVLTIAVPQFISLLYVSKLFSDYGIINTTLLDWGWISSPIPFWTDPTLAKVMVIIINMWVGIPFSMLIATGVLMNIPSDLYESAKIDGASPLQSYMKITLPYMLFVTGPYLLTSFIGNMNNFNVIYLLTGGGPDLLNNGQAGKTDLLITWLYSLTMENDHNYNLAAVIGIMVFIVVAIISLIIYNVLPSTRNEEDFL